MAFPTARDALYGNPPAADHEPDKAVFRDYLESLETMFGAGTIKGFADAEDALPGSGNTVGDLRIVLADPAVDGGVYQWNGTEWDLVAALPTVFWDDAYAREARDWAEGDGEPGGPGTKSAKGWAATVGELATVVATAEQIAEDRELTEAAKEEAELARDGSEAAEAGSVAAQVLSEAARDAAFVAADVYADIATGRAAVADGEQFAVVSSDGLEIIRYRRDSSSTETEVARYPTADAVRPLHRGRINGALDTYFRTFGVSLAAQAGRPRYHSTSGLITSLEIQQGLSPYDGGVLVKTASGTGNLCGQRYYLDEIGAEPGDTVTIRVWVIAVAGSPVTFCPARPLSAAGGLLGSQVNASPASLTATGTPQMLTVEVVTPADTDSIYIYPYTTTAAAQFGQVAHTVYRGTAAETPDTPPLSDEDLARLQLDRISAAVGDGGEAWADPLFTRFELTTAAQLGRARYFGTLTDLSLVANTVRSGQALRVDGNAASLGGSRLWLDDFGAAPGDTLTLRAEVVGSGATCAYAWRALDAAGAVLGTQVTGSVVTSASPRVVTASGVLPAGAVSIRIYPYRSSGSGTFDITGQWGGVGALADDPPAGDAAYVSLLARDNQERIVSLEGGSGGAAGGRVAGVYAPHRLRSLAAKRARLAGGASTTLKIGLFGDSWTADPTRWFDLIRARFDAEIGVDGPGWIAANVEIAVPTGASRIRTGTWTDERTTGVLGPDTSHASTTDPSATFTFGGAGVTHWVVQWVSQPGGGSFDVGLVGGSVVTVSTDAAQAHGVTTITGDGTTGLAISINTVGAGITFLGVQGLADTAPATLFKLGSGGSTAARFVSVPEALFIDAVAALDLDVAVIMLGTNDMSGNVVPAAFRASLETIVSRIRAALPLCDILLCTPGDNGLTGRTYTMVEYADVMFEAAQAGGHAMVDFVDILGPYADANARGLYGDPAHFNVYGGRAMDSYLWKHVLGVAA